MTTIAASPTTVRAVGNVLGRAALFDDRLTADDAARIAVWAEAVEPYEFTEPQMLNAVTVYYRQPRDRSITPGDLISIARDHRRSDAEAEPRVALEARQHANDTRHGLTPPDPAFGGLPIGGAVGDPVWDSYDVNNAITYTCPWCHQPPNHACVDDSGENPRKAPCLWRLLAESDAESGTVRERTVPKADSRRRRTGRRAT